MRGFLAPTLVSVLALAACGGGSQDSGTNADRSAAAQAASPKNSAVSSLALPKGTVASSGKERVDRSLRHAKGQVDVWVSLEDASVSAKRREMAPGVSRRTSNAPLRQALIDYKRTLLASQDGVAASLQGVGGKVLGRVQVAHNAIAVRVDASQLQRIGQMAGVKAVRPVINYEMTLAETVPYIGAAAAQSLGFDGTGVKVAVLDSGIDYTHKNLGGAGTAAAYEAAYGTAPGQPKQTTTDGLFPTAKVVAGFDFVGEGWPNTDRTEDPDPIDFEGHGTHVADIIGGRSTDGTHKGVAPGASLVAVKVCSAVSSSCNGVALLKGVDFALDPNGDGDISDAVDVINMSLGSEYGQQIDDLSQASTEAVEQGVIVVASAGNGGDRPFKTGSPGMALGVLSTAQTQVPSAKAFPLVVNSPPAIAGTYNNTATIDFAPINGTVTGNVAFVGRGCPADSVGPGVPEDPFLAPPLGKVALIDRGGCSVSLKIDRAAKAGATAVLIGLVAPGDAVSFSFGGGTVFVPTLVITQANSNLIKANIAAPVSVTLSPSNAIGLIGSMVSSSSRGPDITRTGVKPEIGAPGASLSAEVGTGTGETAFGGTSGAAPMVAGSAALLRQAFPTRTPEQIKALLMNSAEINILTNPATLPGVLAPITSIGAGEVRVDRALKLTAAARNVASRSASLPFGFAEVAKTANLSSDLLVENFSSSAKTFSITKSFRYANDAASGAVTLDVPTSITVPAGGSATLKAKLAIDGAKLPTWPLNAGPNGGNGPLLQTAEYDGYVTLTNGSEKLSVPWHALLRKSSSTVVTRSSGSVKVGSALNLVNNGVQTGAFEVFALTGTSPKDYPNGGTAGSNLALVDLRAVGVRAVNIGGGAIGLQFAISTHGKRASPLYPGGFEVDIDIDNDGEADAAAYQEELNGFGVTGQSVVRWVNLKTDVTGVSFFNDSDFQSGNAIFTIPTAELGINPSKQFKYTVLAYDNYYSGLLTDLIVDMAYTPLTPRYDVTGDTGPVAANGGSRKLTTTAVAGGAAASPSQSGLLLLYRQNAGVEADIVPIR